MLKILVLLLAVGCLAIENTTPNDKSNEVEPKPPVKLDPALRKALLRAISDLENEQEDLSDSESTTKNEPEESTTELNEILETSDESDKNDFPENSETPVKYQSFLVNAPKFGDNSTSILSSEVKEGEIVNSEDDENIVSKDEENVQSKELNNPLLLSESRNIPKDIQAEETKTSKKPITKTTASISQKSKSTTVKTTTTPKPIYNEDGENIEQLEDVQVFQAPLVAAFTVHQDVNGLPKKVIPIYKQAIRKPITPLQPLNSQNLQNENQKQNQLSSQAFNSNAEIQEQFQDLQSKQVSQNQFQIQQQLALQQQFEIKQRLLEEQLRELQNQQRQHEELLKYQQQQQEFDQQRLKQQQQQEYEQQRLKQQQFLSHQIQQQNLVRVNSFPQDQRIQQNNVLPATDVTFQPSISLQPLPGTVELQPPQKEAVDFLFHIRSKQPSQFPLQSNVPNPPSTQQQLPLERPFQTNFNNVPGQYNLLNQQLPIEKPFQNRFNNPQQNSIQQQQLPGNKQFLNFNNVQVQQPSSTRVFRHDSSTGNFGFNTNNNIFSQNHFLPLNYNRNIRPLQNKPRFDDQLKQLLAQSGLTHGGKSQEDLSIVSKVLSLNHGIPPGSKVISENLSFLFGDSRRNEQQTRPFN